MKLGQLQTLKVEKTVPFGVYLIGDDPQEGRVLLPRSQVPEGTSEGDRLEVFLYKDSEDRMIATRMKPKLMLHQVGYLTVLQVGRIGAFLDWGLDKDLLLPFHEQPRERVKEGQEVLVAVYLDKSERLCATMKLYDYLSSDSPYKKNDHVRGYIYEITDSFGAFVVVDDKYSALIPHNEMNRVLNVGDEIDARVKDVQDDGKLTLSLQEKAKKQMKEDADIIFDRLESSGGFLPFHDKTNPEIIKREFGISKAAFKRAIGRLKKQGRIDIGEDGIRKI